MQQVSQAQAHLFHISIPTSKAHTPTFPLLIHLSPLTNPLPDLADYLVRKGVPFRETHHISGQVVALAEQRNMPMDKLSHADLQSVDQRLGADFIFDYEKSVEMRSAKGGTSRSSVREQIRVLKGLLVGAGGGSLDGNSISSSESFS